MIRHRAHRLCLLVVAFLALALSAQPSTGAAAAAAPTVVGLSPMAGPLSGGTKVTVAGSGFTAKSTVLFGSTPSAKVTYLSPTRLTAVSPAHAAGTVQMRVRVGALTSPVKAGVSFTYRKTVTPPPQPLSVRTAVPARLPVGGGLVSLAGTGFTKVRSVKVDGQQVPYKIESTQHLRFTVPGGAEGPVVVTVSDGTATVPVPMSRASLPGLAQRPPLRGVTDRSTVPPDSPIVSGGTIEVQWATVEPTAGGPLDVAAIHTLLDAADAAGTPVRLRVVGARVTPSWVLQKVGSVQWRDTHLGKVITYTIPRWWLSSYQDLFEAFQSRLAVELAWHPSVSEVTVSECSTVYGEPFMRQSGIPNATTIKSTNYTYLDDLRCLYRSIDATAAIWPAQRVALPVNPFQGFTPPSGDRKLLDTFAVMDYCRGLLGERCVLGNHSLRGTTDATMTCPDGSVVPASGQQGGYDELYCRLRAAGAPTYYQTARSSTIGSWTATLDRALVYGAGNVELNVDYPTYDPVLLAQYDLALEGGLPPVEGRGR